MIYTVASILPTQFRVNRPFGSEVRNSFSFFSSGGQLIRTSVSILDSLVESHIGNIPVMFDGNWPRCIGGVVI